MNTTLVQLALLAWVPFTLALFTWVRPTRAVAISLVGASILLPVGVGFDFPGMPRMDRERLAAAASLLACALYVPNALRRTFPGGSVEWLLLVMVVGGFATAYTNPDPLMLPGKGRLPGLSFWEGLSQAGITVLSFWIPFYLGRALFRSPRALRDLLLVWAVAGLLYSLLVLWEVRMSPRLHLNLYGYLPAMWRQNVRAGGFRPMVFAGHGLALTMFLLTAAIAAVGLWRARVRVLRQDLVWGGPWLYGVLLLCRSLGTQVYATLVLPCQAFLATRTQRVVLLVLVGVVFTYPISRAVGLFPTATLVTAASRLSEARAASLDYRFVNEDILSERAWERPLFGWGRFGRNLVYDERTGRQDVRTDGYWIAQFGEAGFVGFAAAFGILLLPVVLAMRVLPRRRETRDGTLLLAAAWIVTVSAVDLLPNGFLSSRVLLAAGAVVGAAEGARRAGRRPRRERPASGPAGPPPRQRPAEPPPTLGGLLTGRSGAPSRGNFGRRGEEGP